MAKTVLVMHGYSSKNKGDGLLVLEAIAAIKIAAPDCDVHLIATHPDSFVDFPVSKVIPVFAARGIWSKSFVATLLNIKRYTAVVGVGGGYLRGRTPAEILKFSIVHLPQVVAASRVRSVYLPQSIGPLPAWMIWIVNKLLRNSNGVFVRDDRSLNICRFPATRSPDMAVKLVAESVFRSPNTVSLVPVLSSKVGLAPSTDSRVKSLARALGKFDYYNQSEVASNNDRAANEALRGDRELSRTDFLAKPRRVVVAVRLHAALMALEAGHWVIHLAYERKGFGAFQDLGLGDFVHGVNSFNVAEVRDQAYTLLSDEKERMRYDELINQSRHAINVSNSGVHSALAEAING